MSKTLEILESIKSQIYTQYGLKIENFLPEKESIEYHSHTFTLGSKNGLFKIAKKTPTKTGYFVTIWKRGPDHIITPYHKDDLIDFVVIAVSDFPHLGVFIFPKEILLKQGIFSENSQEGKRAIRVYTPWDTLTSGQALKTQKWQNEFFIQLTDSR